MPALPDFAFFGVCFLYCVFVSVWFVVGRELVHWALRLIDKMRMLGRALNDRFER
jgi:hypothetical protein